MTHLAVRLFKVQFELRPNSIGTSRLNVFQILKNTVPGGINNLMQVNRCGVLFKLAAQQVHKYHVMFIP
jgi:hypothetical protein